MTSQPSNPPLSSKEERTWRTVIRLMVMLPRAMDEDLARRSGVSLTRYIVLMRLSEAPGGSLRMSDLAVAASISPSRITRIVASMVGEGLVSRTRASDDGRAHLAILTDAGRARLDEAWPHHLAGVRALVMDHLTPRDLDDFERVAHRLVEAIEAAESTTCIRPLPGTDQTESDTP